MLNQTSKEFKIQFLTEFTREILRATDTYLKLKIREETKKPKDQRFKDTGKTFEEKKNIKELVNEKLQKEIEMLKKPTSLGENLAWIPSKNLKRAKNREEGLKKIDPGFKIPSLRIHEPPVPHTISDISPEPNNKFIELGRLNPLAKDPLVNTFEISGPNQPVMVTGVMGRKKTRISLNKNEINSIIRKFSEESKIPFEEGFFKAAVGRLAMSAIISEATGSKFVITKLGKGMQM